MEVGSTSRGEAPADFFETRTQQALMVIVGRAQKGFAVRQAGFEPATLDSDGESPPCGNRSIFRVFRHFRVYLDGLIRRPFCDG